MFYGHMHIEALHSRGMRFKCVLRQIQQRPGRTGQVCMAGCEDLHVSWLNCELFSYNFSSFVGLRSPYQAGREQRTGDLPMNITQK